MRVGSVAGGVTDALPLPAEMYDQKLEQGSNALHRSNESDFKDKDGQQRQNATQVL